jgi:hypothetical protein
MKQNELPLAIRRSRDAIRRMATNERRAVFLRTKMDGRYTAKEEAKSAQKEGVRAAMNLLHWLFGGNNHEDPDRSLDNDP